MPLELAPYNAAMRLGQGFNSYTHEICLSNAVDVDPNAKGGDHYVNGEAQVISQIVSYCSRHVTKLSQVTDAMNLSASSAIKSGDIGSSVGGSFIDADKFKESDINYFVQVQVTNQVVMTEDVTRYLPFDGVEVDGKTFTKIYGDCFISGFIEGGEFDALISIKINEDLKKEDGLVAKAWILRQLEETFGQGQKPTAWAPGLDLLKRSGYLSDTTVTVNWLGGGQVKHAGTPWNMETVAAAAASFSDNISHVPQRIYAILSKYTTLRTYHMFGPTSGTLNYENAGIYTNSLLDLYMDYKNIWKQIHLMSIEVEFSRGRLLKSEFTPQQKEGASNNKDIAAEVTRLLSKSIASGESAGVMDAVTKLLGQLGAQQKVQRAWEPTLEGLDLARKRCRAEMISIVKEIDDITDDPELASNPDRVPPCMNPGVFRKLLPLLIIDEELIGDSADAGVDASRLKFYMKNKKDLTPAIEKLVKRIGADGTQGVHMSEYVGDAASATAATFWDDFSSVRSTSGISKIEVFYNDTYIVGLRTTLTDMTTLTHGNTTSNLVDSWQVNPGETIIAANLYARKIGGRAVLTDIKFASSDLDNKHLGVNRGKPIPADYESLSTVTPKRSYSLKGFWGSFKGGAFETFGVFYGQNAAGAAQPPRANDDAESILPSTSGDVGDGDAEDAANQ